MPKKSKVYDLHYEGLTPEQISKVTGLKKKSIHTLLNRKGIHVNRTELIDNPEKLEQFIRGSLLGDGCIAKGASTKHEKRISFTHCLRQVPYLQWKLDILSEFGLVKGRINKYTHISDRYKSGECSSYTASSIAHPIFTKFRELYYNKRKFLNKKDIMKMDAFALAIWYMDDGNVWNGKAKSSCISLNTCSFTEEDNKFLIGLLKEKFSILCTYNKSSNTIRVSSKSCDRLIELVKPFMVDCMLYKTELIKRNGNRKIRLGKLQGTVS